MEIKISKYYKSTVITPVISIIIVNYNVRDFLINSLISLKKSLHNIPNEIFVIDNASLDDSVSVTETLFPEVIIIRSNVNLGFAKANNLALKESKGKYILLLNPDTLIQEDTIVEMLKYFEMNPEAGIAGCKILNADGTLQLACRRTFPTPWSAFSKLVGLSKLFPKTKLFGKYNLTYLDSDKTYEVEAISGSFMMFKQEVYNDIGGLDEDFFMYGEDLDWLYRANKHNWKTFYVSSTQIIHYKGESTKRSDVDSITKFYEAMHLFVKKHYKSPSLIVPILRTGIIFRSSVAFLARIWKKYFGLVIDSTIIIALIFFSEYLRFGKFFNFPDYAYPTIFIVTPLVFLSTFIAFGIYRKYRMSISRNVIAIVFSFLLLSSLTYFIKTYAFSRAVLLIVSSLSLLLLPGWRIFIRFFERGFIRSLFNHQNRILGKRTIIVGLDKKDIGFISKLKNDYLKDYNIVGLLLKDQFKDNQSIKDFPILGSLDGLSGIIKKFEIEEVIFSTNDLTYSEILSLISSCKYKYPSFKLIPHEKSILESTGRGSFDNIDLVEIELKINKFFNKFNKRTFDILSSFILIIIIMPFLIFKKKRNNKIHVFVLSLKKVFLGERSIVGILPIDNDSINNIALGKIGLTGLAHINKNKNVSDEEYLKYNILYARNQTFFLDLEIIFRALLLYFKIRRT